METIILSPRNAQELAFVTEFVKRTKLKATFVVDEKRKKKKEFLDSFDGRVNQVNRHMRGEIELPTLDEFLNGL